MSASDTDKQPHTETVEHLLGIVVENREKRCAQVRDHARQQAEAIVQQAHGKSRARMRRHVTALREKQRQRVSSATARNQTLLRQQQQKADRAVIDMAWPLLRDAVQALWDDTASRQRWLDLVMSSTTSRLLQQDICIEHPGDISEQELGRLKQQLDDAGRQYVFVASDDITAGIRILAHGTVMDATLDGLLKQRSSIEALLIARIKQQADADA